MLTIVFLICALLVILIASQIFTNSLEHIGTRLGISEGVTGSIFAAVGTALPETTVPLVAIFAGTASHRINEEIGVGAILGAPLMLSTLAFGLMMLFSFRKRTMKGQYTPEHSGVKRDFDTFLLAFVMAIIAMFISHDYKIIRAGIAIALILTYFIYVLRTIKASEKLVRDGHATSVEDPLYLNRIGLPENMTTIVIQLILGLGLLVGGAKWLIINIEAGSHMMGISPLVLSLLIIPVATEMPEKVNSILWIRRRKDTLAFGNITGAMVFQGTLLPAIGILLTPWEPRYDVIVGVTITMIAALWMRTVVNSRRIAVWTLGINGLLYLTYLFITVIIPLIRK